jgi:hypothetical protein
MITNFGNKAISIATEIVDKTEGEQPRPKGRGF